MAETDSSRFPSVIVPAFLAGSPCEMCTERDGGPSAIYLHGRCHMTAPSWVSIEYGWLVVRCYIPECKREIGRFRIIVENEPKS